MKLKNKKITTSDLRNTKNIFQIKFNHENWNKLARLTGPYGQYLDVLNNKNRSQAYAYLEPLFVKYRNNLKMNFHYFAVKWSSGHETNNYYSSFKCTVSDRVLTRNGYTCGIYPIDKEEKFYMITVATDLSVNLKTNDKIYFLDTKTNQHSTFNVVKRGFLHFQMTRDMFIF